MSVAKHATGQSEKRVAISSPNGTKHCSKNKPGQCSNNQKHKIDSVFKKDNFPDSPLVGTGKVRTLYACVGEHESELSFEPNQVITNGKLFYIIFSHSPV